MEVSSWENSSISMGHLYHGELLNNQRVYQKVDAGFITNVPLHIFTCVYCAFWCVLWSIFDSDMEDAAVQIDYNVQSI